MLVAVTAHLIFLPWAIGTMWPWAQWTSLGLAAIGFVVVLIPRDYTEEHSDAGSFRFRAGPRLLRFPIFWIGLALLGYVALQGFNPAWVYTRESKEWWMQRVAHIGWLPPGYEAPFRAWNPWRMLVIYASAWLMVCTIWVGFTRRRSLQFLLIALTINGLVLAVFGVLQRLSGATKIFGFFPSPNPSFFASFVYKNHGGAYLLLALTMACGIAGWYYIRGLRRMEKSNPSAVLAFVALCIAVGIFFSLARGATLTMAVLLLGCTAAIIVRQFLLPRESRKPLVAVVLLIIFGIFAKIGFDTMRGEDAWERLRVGITRKDDSLALREHATVAAIEMLKEHWIAGTGAGSFRFLFPIYQHRYPILIEGGTPGRRMFWEHAHNDIVQIPIEFGASGMALLLAAFGYWTARLLRFQFWRNPLSGAVIFGALLLAVYAWWDFPFQCPAVLLTWCALWPIATLWAQFERSSGKA